MEWCRNEVTGVECSDMMEQSEVSQCGLRMKTGMGGIRQCGLRMENWNDCKWKMNALEWSGN